MARKPVMRGGNSGGSHINIGGASSSSRGGVCGNGVFCIENMTLLILVVIFGVGLYFFLNNRGHSGGIASLGGRIGGLVGIPTRLQPTDVVQNPYTPPLRANPYFGGHGGQVVSVVDVRGGIPINQETSSSSFSSQPGYTTVGILKRASGGDGRNKVLQLMGRPLQRNGDKWEYYTFSDSNGMIKLPISVNGRSCSQEHGCKEVYNGDTVYVEGLDDVYKVTVYESASARYIPTI